MAIPVVIRAFGSQDLGWVEAVVRREFGETLQARRGELIDLRELPGLVAEREGRPVGLLSYRLDGGDCELAFILAVERGRGVGTALVEELRQVAASSGCSRIWVVTTNDNLDALRFYQRRGFTFRAVSPGAADDARRRLKPEMPEIGAYGIPLRDELELVLPLE